MTGEDEVRPATDETRYAVTGTDSTPEPARQVDWEALRQAAVGMTGRAYVPYSRYPVGVAGLVADGRVVRGCNVENASYGVTLCAECGMVSDLIASGGGRLVAVWCVDGSGHTLMPCGRCRQLLWEHGGGDCLLQTPEGVLAMTQVLPQAFGPEHLRDYERGTSG